MLKSYGGWVGGLQHLVSAQGPLVLGFWVWGQLFAIPRLEAFYLICRGHISTYLTSELTIK